MNIYHRRLFRAIVTIFAIAAVPATFAANKTQDFYNDTTLNYAFLFADSPAISFTDLKFKSGFDGWTLETLTPTMAVFFGPEVAATAGRFQLKFDYSAPVAAFQWAEALFDAAANTYTINASGTAQYNRTTGAGSWGGTSSFAAANAAYIDSYFTPVIPPSSSVPLPASLVLLLSAAALLGITRRRELILPALRAEA